MSRTDEREPRDVSAQAPTPEQEAAIGVAGRDVLLEAGAGTGKTGVMVERYCRLVCEQGVGADAILAFTFTERAAAELRHRIRAELGRRAALGSARAAAAVAAIGGAWVTTIHGFCSRLLAAHPVAAGIEPGFRVLDAPEATRAAREAFEQAIEEFLAEGGPAREETLAVFGLDGLRGMVLAAHAELRSRGEAEPRLPEPPPTDPEGANLAARGCGRGRPGRAGRGGPQARAARARGRAAAGARAAAGPGRAARAGAGEQSAGPAPLPRGDRGGDLAQRRRRAREARPTGTSPSCSSSSRPATRRPRSAAPGSTSRTCSCSRRGSWSGRRSARAIARASVTCWSTSSRTPTACSCG